MRGIALIVGAALTACDPSSALPKGDGGDAGFADDGGADGGVDGGAIAPKLAGLMDCCRTPPNPAYYSTVQNFGVSLLWRDVQPTQGGSIVRNNGFDTAVSRVQQLNSTMGLNMRLKIRVKAGKDAPDWAKQIGGAPFTMTDPNDGSLGTVGRFWDPVYKNAYDDLQTKLAAIYDGVPEIEEVTITGCMTIYPEPYLRNLQANSAASTSNIAALMAAGYTTALDQQCLTDEISAHQVWTRVRSALSFNPYQTFDSSGKLVTDEAFTENQMALCRQTLGLRCVLENESIRYPMVSGQYTPMFAKMKALGPPMTFQTALPPALGDLKQTLAWAVAEGANAVELQMGYDNPILSGATLSDLMSFDAMLRANPTQ